MLSTERLVVPCVSALAILGVSLLLCAAAISERRYGTTADERELLAILGGDPCQSAQQASLTCCIDCQANGNNGYVKCTTYGFCQKCVKYQNPNECIACKALDPAMCQGNIVTYDTLSDCQNNVGGTPGGQCLRTYSVVGIGTCPGNCP